MDVHFVGIMRSYDLNLVKPQWLLCIQAKGWAKTTDAGHDGPIFEFHTNIREKVTFVVRNLTTPNDENKQQLNAALLSYHPLHYWNVIHNPRIFPRVFVDHG